MSAPPTCGAWSCPARPTDAPTSGDAMCRCSEASIVAACEYWRREAERLREEAKGEIVRKTADVDRPFFDWAKIEGVGL